MPGKKARQREQKVAGMKHQRPRFLMAATALLSLFATCSMLTHSGALDSVSSRKVSRARTVSIESLNSNNPSKEYIYAGARLITTEDDFQPPSFPGGCPPVNVAAAFQYPYATGAPVTYGNPVANDNNPGVIVSCNPSSGSTFPVGLTTVTCTATDTSGNTATCSFVVNVFSAGLADDTNPGNVVLFNASTGDYRFCCNGVIAASGRGMVSVINDTVNIHHVKGDRTIDISVTGTGSGNGSATIQNTRRGLICQIHDAQMSGDSCTCP